MLGHRDITFITVLLYMQGDITLLYGLIHNHIGIKCETVASHNASELISSSPQLNKKNNTA